MALQIDEGMLPSEESLYESVVSWAKYGKMEKATLLAVDDNDHDDKEDEQVKETSVGNTFGVDQKHQDDEHSGEDDNDSSNNKSVIQSGSHSESDDENGLSFDDELEDRQGDLAEILQYIRFPLIQPSFLVNVVEKDSFVMDLPGVRDLVCCCNCSFFIIYILIYFQRRIYANCAVKSIIVIFMNSFLKLIDIMLWEI